MPKLPVSLSRAPKPYAYVSIGTLALSLLKSTHQDQPLLRQWLLSDFVSSSAQSLAELGERLWPWSAHVVSFWVVGVKGARDTGGDCRDDFCPTKTQAHQFGFGTHTTTPPS